MFAYRFTKLSLFCLLFLSSCLFAQEPEESPNNYKRLHQDALSQLLAGQAEKAAAAMEKLSKQHPTDAETHYLLSLIYHKQGQSELAVASAQSALAAGLPPGRLVAGAELGLAPLADAAALQEKLAHLKHQPVHGPMLGSATGESVVVWLRTWGETKVQAVASKEKEFAETIASAETSTQASDDYTAVLKLTGLAPATKYFYRLKIGGKLAPQTYSFQTLPASGEPGKLRIAFGGGAGYVPAHERMWTTIEKQQPQALLLLGDNVYSDDPKTPAMQHYCYYRRQSRPEFSSLAAKTPVFSIWDDHDFGTNDCSGGPEIDKPAWKRPVYGVFRNNWANPAYGGGDKNPGCYYDFYLADIHFIMLDGRYYRTHLGKDNPKNSMLGPVQLQWLKETLQGSKGKLIVLCSPVPWTYVAKGDSPDTWNGFKHERDSIFNFFAEHKMEGVMLMSADRHRSDLWKIERENGYTLYEFNSSRLTNQHVHPEMKEAVFSYNKKQSFGLVDFDTTAADPFITYRIVSIDGEEIHSATIHRSELVHP